MSALRATSALRDPSAVRSGGPRGLRPAAVDRPGAVAGAARPLSDVVRTRMETAFGADFSDVRIRQDDAPSAADALALTQGTDISVLPGAVDLHSPEGLALIGHELAHVLQQRAGRVRGRELTEDPALEAEADEAGRRAARGEPVGTAGPDVATSGSAAASEGATPAVAQPGGKELLRRLRQRTGATPPAPQAPAPAPAAPVPPGSLDRAAIEEQIADMQQLMNSLVAEVRRPGLTDARPIAAKMKKVEGIMHALVDASVRALPPAPDLPDLESESEFSPGPARAPLAYAPLPPRGQETPYQPIPVPPPTYAKTPSDDPNAGIYAETPVSFEELPTLPARSAEPEEEGHYSTLPSFPEEAPAESRLPSEIVRDAVRAARGTVTVETLRVGGVDRATAAARHREFLQQLQDIAGSADRQMEPDTAQIQREIDDLVRKYTG